MINLGKIKSFDLGKLVFVVGRGISLSYLAVRCSFQPEYYTKNGKEYNAKGLLFELSFLQKRYFIGILFYGKETELQLCKCVTNRKENN